MLYVMLMFVYWICLRDEIYVVNALWPYFYFFAPVWQYESHQKTCVKTAASAKQLYCCFLSPAAVVTQAPPKVLHYSSSFGDATLFTPYIVLLAGRLSHEDKAWVGKPGDLLNNSHASDGMPPFEFPRSSSGDCCYRSLQLIHAYFCS